MTRNCRMSFELLPTDGRARRGRLTFPRGAVEAPACMAVWWTKFHLVLHLARD